MARDGGATRDPVADDYEIRQVLWEDVRMGPQSGAGLLRLGDQVGSLEQKSSAVPRVRESSGEARQLEGNWR